MELPQQVPGPADPERVQQMGQRAQAPTSPAHHPLDAHYGQSELTATNAPVGRSVHWMGCVFSFGAGWGSSQSISHFPTLISIAPTY